MKVKLITTSLILLYAAAFSLNFFEMPKQDPRKKPAIETSYGVQWSKVDSLAKKGLNKSALQVVMDIYEKARQEKNTTQFLKAVIHRMKFESFTEEDDIQKSIADLKRECAEAEFPANVILHSLIAETYWNYYQQNRWKFMERTETKGTVSDDISTWDLRKILEQVISEYRHSLENKPGQQKIQVNVFDEVIIKGSTEEARRFRPSLYDFLAHRALDFFMNSESGLTQPVDQYKIDAAWYLSHVDLFLNFGLDQKDSLESKYNAILILQDLLRFHQNDAHPGAFIDANLKRLKFVHGELTIAKKDSLYLHELEKLAAQYVNFPGSTDALYETASLYFNKGNEYHSGDNDSIRLLKRTAERICDSAIAHFPYSQGGLNCKHLKALINEKHLSFKTEKVNVPDQPFLGTVNYRNISKFFVRVAAFKEGREDQETGLYGERLVKYYLSLPPVKEWTVAIPDDGDRQTHTAEFSIPGLPVGKYVVLVSSSEKFSTEKNSISYSTVYSSNLSCINRRKEGGHDIYVLNRSTGEPMQNVQATLYTSEYNYSTRNYESKRGATYTTDSNGYLNLAAMELDGKARNFNLELVSGKDRLFLNDNLFLYRYNGADQPRFSTNTWFFTDRSIYRPGQTIYFKGITLQSENEVSRIRPNFKTTVALYDVNSQKISELLLETNEYGSFNGSFTAPQGVLTGLMRIQNESGTRYFSVEEYKRPKFEVTFLPVQGSFRVNDRITVFAKAKSYTGANVSDAKVTYRVTRSAQMPFDGIYRMKYFPVSPQTEIASGVTVTDANGQTVITFDAIADAKFPKESNPVFNFQVTADVTDVNGETHSHSQGISVSYTALMISTTLQEEVSSGALDSITIQTRNMAGIFEGATGNISIRKLEQPGRLLRSRLMDEPDRHTLTREEFELQFPFDVYENENDPAQWKAVEEVFASDFDTRKDSVINMNKQKRLEPGNYKLEIRSQDKYSREVKHTQFFSVYSAGKKEAPFSSFVYLIPVKTKGEPGEKAQFLIGTRDKNVRILYETEEKNKITSSQWLTLTNEQQLVEIPILESHRGNFVVHFSLVKQNRFYNYSRFVTVPWSNKEIAISMETFRDKLLPGAKEEWKLKLGGKFADRVAAEMLVSMYDGSLDAFTPHVWDFDVWKLTHTLLSFQSGSMFSSLASAGFDKDWNEIPPLKFRTYDELNWFGYVPASRFFADGPMQRGQVMMNAAQDGMAAKMEPEESAEAAAVAGSEKVPAKSPAALPPVKPRTNFSETAFFYPALTTNEKNEVVFSFTMPDALTRWKFMGLAHTKNLEYGMIEKELVTRKDLMVIPNAPRFLREGDSLSFPCKITNLSDTSLTGTATLSFFDALTGENISSKILQHDPAIEFTVTKGGNTNVNWRIAVPEGFSTVKYRVTAQSQKFTDGEEQAIPVLTNRMLVTESLPLWANAGQTKTFSFDHLKNNKSATLKNHRLTLEYTSNPAWIAIQALPYLMEYPYDCSEQVFSRYYANALASHISNSSPKIKAVLDAWKMQSPETFLSNLEKNQELKTVILEQTPWVLDAKNESDRKKRVALLFDLNKMGSELQTALLKLQKKQNPDGSWSWFDGMPDDRYITQYIVEGFGHLDHLGVQSVRSDERTWNMVQQAIRYLDRRISEDYQQLLSLKADLAKNHLSSIQIHYLYARSFYKDLQVDGAYRKALDYYLSQEKKYWLDHTSEYMQGMIALTLSRNEDGGTAGDILKSLKENSQYSEELGRYWKNNTGGYYWGQASIETQSILIEAFHDIAGDKQAVEEMQRWLLKNKQTTNWKTTKATAEACYALLLQGTDFLSQSAPAEISLGRKKISPSPEKDLQVEAGSGYFKTSWSGSDINPEMGDVKVHNRNEVPGWGALHWQYFEQLDKITKHETPLKLTKQLFIEQHSPTGKIIVPLGEQQTAKTGDRLKVRIELRVDRVMEYVMMKDMRASGLEPENVMSSYRWQDGLGYYESTHDASTDFFFSYLPKGTYVFEYPLRVSHEGVFSNGITSIQCMYAPEFGAHSEGIMLRTGTE